MRVLCVFGQFNYGDPTRGEGYEYANFIPTLRRLGHEVLFLESWNRKCHHDFRKLNEVLLRTVEQEQPDVVFSVMFMYEIWLETWNILRDAGIAATVNWATDDSWKYAQFSRLVSPSLHAFTTTYPDVYKRYHKDGIYNVLLSQWAVNSANLKPPIPAIECHYPVTFVGTAHGKRQAWVKELKKRGIDVNCFGHGWPRGSVEAYEIPQIIRNSVVSLNLANSVFVWNNLLPQRENQIKARTFEVPGAGGFLLTEWTEGLDQYFIPGKEIVSFHNLNDLVDKIHYYLAHPVERDAIARAGYERTRVEHTYDRRLGEVLDFALCQREKHFTNRYISPIGKINWEMFESAVQKHNMTQSMRNLRDTLIKACSLIWGPMKGPRAARRLVFEFSWRLVGAHTYSAAGWPGRMFYKES